MTVYTLFATIVAALAVGMILGWLAAHRETSRVRGELVDSRRALATSDLALGAAEGELEATRKFSQEKVDLLLTARQELGDQFRTLAADVLDEKAKTFVELNQATIAQLLTPLQAEIMGFRAKVEETHIAEVAGQSALREKISMLAELNVTLRDETANLTKALKGDAKTQGNWGEVILERLLESAGLIQGEHYDRQESFRDDDGNRAIPDIVINLPDSRHLVVDSKVSLTAYSELAAATDDATRAKALKAHLESVQRHIKGLSAKNYQSLYSLSSIDFVVMFMPLEGAFMAALTNEPELFDTGWKKNVILVSPSTLLFVVRTVAFLWGQEKQKRNYQEIAERGASLYEKFVGFTLDLAKVGEHLGKARVEFDSAWSKLNTGRGNLVRQAEQLRDLGVRPAKLLPIELTGSLGDERDDLIAPVNNALPPS